MAAKYPGIRKASESTIEISFTYQGERYFEKVKLKPDSNGLRIASLFRSEVLAAIEKGTFDFSISFPDSKHAHRFRKKSGLIKDYLLETYLPRFEKYGKARTIKMYRNIITNQLIPPFGEYELHQLSIPIIKEWIDTLKVSPKTIRNTLSPLRSALNEAVEDGLIEQNPLANYSPRVRSTKPVIDEIDPITYEEEAAILAVANPTFKNLLTFALWTGMRPQEYLALTWPDVDFIHGTVLINKAKSDHVKIETTKTKASTRKITLLQPALDALIAQKQHTYLAGKEVFMFNGKRYSGVSQLRRFEWDRAFAKSGVRRRTPKQTRHSFASRMLSAGEPLLWVSKYLGHSTASMTLNAYSRFMPNENQQAGSKAIAQAKNN